LSAEVVEGATEDDFYGIGLKGTCPPKVNKQADLPRFFCDIPWDNRRFVLSGERSGQ
jgi:hypothetical protein